MIPPTMKTAPLMKTWISTKQKADASQAGYVVACEPTTNDQRHLLAYLGLKVGQESSLMIMVTQHRTIVLFICFMKQADIDGDFGLVPPDRRELTCLLAEYDRSTWVLIAVTNELSTVLPPSEYLHHTAKKKNALRVCQQVARPLQHSILQIPWDPKCQSHQKLLLGRRLGLPTRAVFSGIAACMDCP